MAQYEVELSDGTVATVEADHEPSHEEVLAAVEKVPKTTALGTAARGAALSVAPSAAAAAAFGPSAEAGIPFAPLAGPLAPLVPLATGAIGAGIAGLGTSYLQRKALEKIAPGLAETEAAGEMQHPLAASVGHIAGMAPSFAVAPGQAIKGLASIPALVKGVATEAEKKALTGTAAQIGLQTGLTAAQSLATGQGLPSGRELLEAGAAATIFGHPRFTAKLPTFLKKGAADASKVAPPTTLYGDVRTQQEPSKVVSTEGGGERIQPQAEAVAEAAQVPLTPEGFRNLGAGRFETDFPPPPEAFNVTRITKGGKTTYKFRMPAKAMAEEVRAEAERELEEERKAIAEAEAMGIQAKFTDETTDPGDPTVPFGGGSFMRPTGKGVEINRRLFHGWMKEELAQLPPEQRAAAVRARLQEEDLHNQVINGMGGLDQSNAAAQSYWNSLTRFEKLLEHRSYTGHWTPEAYAAQWEGQRFTDAQLGHEVIRRRLQKLAGMDTSEVSQTVGTEKWTIQGINALSDMVQAARDMLGTKASKEQQRIMSRVLDNLDVARAVATGQTPAAARRRLPEDVQDLRPAVRLITGEVLEGRKGETHNDIMREHDLKGVDVDRRGFMGPKGWMDREEGPDSGREVPGMHATELADMQEGKVPAAARRKKQPYEPEQLKMFGVEMMGKKGQIPGEELPVVEPTSAEQAGALPRLTAVDLERAADKEFEGARPSFKDFVDWAQRNMGSAVKSEQLRSLWEDKVWDKLMNATGEQLAKYRHALQLEEKLGVGPIPEKTATGKTVYRAGKTLRAPEQRRITAVTEIAKKLLSEAMPRLKDLSRTEITLDDVDFQNAKTTAGAFHIFGEAESRNPDRIAEVLSDRARYSKDEPVSVTKRLAVLINRATGEVEIVDAYKHGREGVQLTDPSGATGVRGKPHVALKNLLGRYRVRAAILIDEPVQNFRQHFDSVREYTEALEKEGAQRESVAEHEIAGEALPHEVEEAPEGLRPEDIAQELPPTQVTEGEGGTVAGPHAGEARGLMGIGRGAVERTRTTPLTANEVNALREFVGPIESKEDMANAVKELLRLGREQQEPPYKPTGKKTFRELKEELPRYRFRGIHRSTVSAIQKAARGILREVAQENRGLKPEERTYITDDQAYELALDHFYDALTNTETPEQYTAQALGRFASRTGEGIPATGIRVPGAPAQAKGVSRELSMLSRIPPTVARDVAGRPIRGAQPQPEMTFGAPGRVTPPEMLPETAKAFVEQAAKAEEYTPMARPGKPTGRITQYGAPQFRTKSGLVGPRPEPQEVPGAVRRHKAEMTPEEKLAEAKKHVKFLENQFAVNKEERENMRNELIKAWMDALDKNYPGSIRRFHKVVQEEYDRYKTMVGSVGKRSSTEKEIFATRDGAEHVADMYASDMAEAIRLASREPGVGPEIDKKAAMVRRAARAVVAATTRDKAGNVTVNRKLFDNVFLPQIETGIMKANAMIESINPATRWVGRRYLKGAQMLKEEVEWARDNFQNQQLQETVATYQEAMQQHRQWMNANGAHIADKENYIPGRYDGAMWQDGHFTWGDLRIIGTQYRMPKTFDNPYQAISKGAYVPIGKDIHDPKGPFIPISHDMADLAQNSIALGARAINRQMWLESLMTLRDPVSKDLVAKKAIGIPVKIEVEDPETGGLKVVDDWQWKSPSPAYELVRVSDHSHPVAIRTSYKRLVDLALSRSKIDEIPGGKQAKMVSAMLKHGLILIMDTYHAGRLAEYYAALGGGKWRGLFKKTGGWSALTWPEPLLPQAVEKGLIPKEAMDWALEEIKINDRGRILTMTRQQLLRDAVSRGLNAAKIADALYRNAIQKIPLIGEHWNALMEPMNKWLFDKFTPGLIAESFVRNFERLNAANKNVSRSKLMADVIRDTNTFYGNLGRQGWFRSPTFRDLAQIFVLAPMWQEGLIRKEATALSRFSGLSYLMGRRGMGANQYFGTLGRAMGRGLAAWFVTTQIINLATKGHPTWMNEEEDHKLDAWIGDPEMKSGVWLSTLGVFAELTHDLMRLGSSKPKVWDAITQVGENKVGPIGRIAHILSSGETPSGEAISTTGGVLKAAAAELAPVPIALSKGPQFFGHLLAPKYVPPLKPGEMTQKWLSVTGIKSQTGTRATQDIQRKAEKFLRQQGLKYEPMKFTPTDEPSYAKLRAAVRNNDIRGAKNMLAELRKTRSDQQIAHALRVSATHPFTGSKKHEKMFLYSLNDRDLDLYHKATMEKAENYQAALQLMLEQ